MFACSMMPSWTTMAPSWLPAHQTDPSRCLMSKVASKDSLQTSEGKSHLCFWISNHIYINLAYRNYTTWLLYSCSRCVLVVYSCARCVLGVYSCVRRVLGVYSCARCVLGVYSCARCVLIPCWLLQPWRPSMAAGLGSPHVWRPDCLMWLWQEGHHLEGDKWHLGKALRILQPRLLRYNDCYCVTQSCKRYYEKKWLFNK